MQPHHRSSITGEEGSAYVEYLVVVGLFGLVTAGAIAALGLPLLRSYQLVSMLLSLPVP